MMNFDYDEKTLQEIITQNCVLKEENLELQKQVNELTEQLRKLKLAHTSLCEECADYCPRVPQAVKNTAKKCKQVIKAKLYPNNEWVDRLFEEEFGVEIV